MIGDSRRPPSRKRTKKAKRYPYTQKTLKHLRELGYTCGITEKWNSFCNIRQDLFGFIDIVAIREGSMLAVQSTSDGGLREHYKKITEDPKVAPNAQLWLKAGGEIWLVTWKKFPKGKSFRYEYTVTRIDHGDFQCQAA